MRWTITSVILAGVSLLASFAALADDDPRMSKRDCVRAEWQRLGRFDGVQGLGAGALQTRTERCTRHKTTVDTSAYETGYREGVAVFCTPTGALDAANLGAGDPSLCRGENAAAVATAHAAGMRLYQAEDKARSEENNYNTHRNGLQYTQSRINQLIAEHNAATDPALRAKRAEQIQSERRSMQSTQLLLPSYAERAATARAQATSAKAVVDALRAELQVQTFRSQLPTAPPAAPAPQSAPPPAPQ